MKKTLSILLAALMIVGALMFLLFVPKWVWASALGVVLISVGFVLWRFGGD